MKSSDVFNLLASATFCYVDVTQKEIDAVESAKYISELEGKKLLGTLVEIEELAAKQILPGTMVFG